MGVIFIMVCFNVSTIIFYYIDLFLRRSYLLSRNLLVAKYHWQEIINSLPIGVALLNYENKVKYINYELGALSHLPDVDWENQAQPNGNEIQREGNQSAIFSFFSTFIEKAADSNRTLEEIVLSHTQGTKNLHMQSADGAQTYEVKLKELVAVSNHQDKIIVFNDISDHEQLIKGKIKDQYQRMLSSSLSHEIRNPLNAVQGLLSLLETRSIAVNLDEICKRIECQVQKINYIIQGSDELMVATQTQDTLPVPKPFDLREAVNEIVELFHYDMEEKRLLKIVQIGERVPDYICSHSRKYCLILFNLLSNAIKYTSEGTIKLSLFYDTLTRRLTTQVTDTGIGIPPDRFESLFKLFSNIENANSINPQGMGMGLAICKKMAEYLEGNISAISTPGEGSCFTFSILDCESPAEFFSSLEDEIPLEQPFGLDTHSIPPFILSTQFLRSEPEKERCSCSPVLIVDDEPSNRYALRAFLKSKRITPDEAENGLEAVEKVEKRARNSCCQRYNLILMDINMPIMDGTEAASKIAEIFKERPRARSTLIAVTAADFDARPQLLRRGFTEMIQKPVSRRMFNNIFSLYF